MSEKDYQSVQDYCIQAKNVLNELKKHVFEIGKNYYTLDELNEMVLKYPVFELGMIVCEKIKSKINEATISDEKKKTSLPGVEEKEELPVVINDNLPVPANVSESSDENIESSYSRKDVVNNVLL